MPEKIKYPEFNLDIPKIGYYMAVKRKKRDFVGSRIERVQLSRGYNPEDACYIHVEILSGGSDSMRIQPPRAKMIDITKYYKGRYIKIMAIDSILYDEWGRYKICVLYNSFCNKRYDYLGGLRFILPFIPQSKKNPFCSEGVTEPTQKVLDWFLIEYRPHEVLPATIVSANCMVTKWEGIIP